MWRFEREASILWPKLVTLSLSSTDDQTQDRGFIICFTIGFSPSNSQLFTNLVNTLGIDSTADSISLHFNLLRTIHLLKPSDFQSNFLNPIEPIVQIKTFSRTLRSFTLDFTFRFKLRFRFLWFFKWEPSSKLSRRKSQFELWKVEEKGIGFGQESFEKL